MVESARFESSAGNVWGVDLNSSKIAAVTLDRFETIELHRSLPRAAILDGLHYGMKTLLSPGDVVYVESPVLAGVRNIQSTIKVAAAYGAVLAAINAAHATAIETPVSLWKVATVGRGNASKLDVSDWLYAQHPDHHRECDGDQDLIDATCIALFAQTRARTCGRGVHHQAAVEEHPRHRNH